MKIPVYDQSVTQNEGRSLVVPNLSAPPPGAFGTGVAEATKGLGQTVERVGAVLADHMIEQEHQRQTAQVIQADNQFRVNLQKAMFDTTPDDKTNVPKGVFNREGLQAGGATIDFDNQFKQMRQQSIDVMDSPYKKQRLGEMMDENYPRLRELVAKHEGAQVRVGQNSIVDGNLQLRVQDAPNYMEDPEGLLKTIETGKHLKYASMVANGVDDTKIAATLNDFSGKVVKSAINPLLHDNPDGAQAYFDRITGNKNNPLSAQDQEAIQKIIDTSKDQFKKKQEKHYAIATNTSEAEVASHLVNGELTPLALDEAKGHVTPEFYNLAATALKNDGVSEGTEQQKASKAVTLLKEYGQIAGNADEDKRTAALMKFRRDVLAESTKLDPVSFKKLLSYSDPNFVAKITPEKAGFLQAGWDWIKDHYQKYATGTTPSQAMTSFMDKAMDPSTKNADIPAIAQDAVKSDVLKENPSLVGQADLSNNVTSQANGTRQVYTGATVLKPQQTIKSPQQFKPGDEQKKDGVTYVRGEDGKWREKP